MAGYLLEMFGISLGLTLIIELGLGCLMGLRSVKQLLLILLMNILTNPAAVLLHWLGIPQLTVEIFVLITEAWILVMFSRKEEWNIFHPIFLALVLNSVSWISGILLQRIGG